MATEQKDMDHQRDRTHIVNGDEIELINKHNDNESDDDNNVDIDEEKVNSPNLRTPTVPRLKSDLSGLKSTNGNGTIDDVVITGQTIENKLKSSVDVILYDDDTINNTDNTRSSTLNRKTTTNDDIDHNNYYHENKIKIINATDTINSSIDDDEEEEEEDIDIMDNRDDDIDNDTNTRNKTNIDNNIKCNCCLWLKKYKKSIIPTIILSILTGLIFNFIDINSTSIQILYLEFTLFVFTVLMISRICWKFMSYLLFICTVRKYCRCYGSNFEKFIFYIHHSGTYLFLSLLAIFIYGFFLYFQQHPTWSRFDKIIENTDIKNIEFINKILLCSTVLFIGLFLKTLLIRWICLTYYLANNLLKIKKMKQYESWLKILLKTRRIFSIKVKEFLNINEIHINYHQDSNLNGLRKTIAFRVNILAFQDEYNLSTDYNENDILYEEEDKDDDDVDDGNDNIDILNDSINNKLVNTLTSATMFNYNCSQKEYAHNVQTCLLWLYNAKMDKVTVIDDNELDKLCKQFAKYIVLSVAKDRFHSKTPNNLPSFTELRARFANYGRSSLSMNNGEEKPEPTPYRLKRSSLAVGGDFITQNEFIRCFTKLNETRKGYDAWKEINISDKQLTKKELQRWLYQYLHSLIYLKQTLNSYQEILSNLDVSANIIAIFILFFLFLLIFEFDFQDSISIYFSMIAIFAVFGRNVFTQFFDAVYFIFILSPYNIGDVVLIDNIRYTIKKIHIMSTEMITSVNNGNTVIIKNNALLLGKDIKNLSKTKSPYHNISFFVSQNTSINELNVLKSRIDRFIRIKMKNDINDIWFILDGVDKECRMKISLFLGSIYSFSDSASYWKQYHIINMQIRKIVNEMGIQYKRFSNQDIQLSALIEDSNHNSK